MIRFTGGKLAFIHARLWTRQPSYRVAFLLGPVLLAGAICGLVIWNAILPLQGMFSNSVPWAAPLAADESHTSAAAPVTLSPARPLPDSGERAAGLQPGWVIAAHQIELDSTFIVATKPPVLSQFAVAGPAIDMVQILEGGPKNVLFAAVGSGFLVARTSGVYEIAARFDRPASSAATCVIRLRLPPHSVNNNLQVNVTNSAAIVYQPAWINLQPGLYLVSWQFGCWHDQIPSGPGRMTLLLKHPGETQLAPARPDDFVR